jgi:hypothetical protein
MEKEKLESLLIEYLDGTLSQNETLLVEAELKTNVEARILIAQLQQMLGAIKNSNTLQPTAALQHNKAKQVFMFPKLYKAAAAIGLVLMCIGIGYWAHKNQEQANELAKLKQEMEATKKMLMAMLDNQQSASQRVQAATIAYAMTRPDYEVVNALVKAMNEDSNTNVRLAALDALSKFYYEEPIRKILIRSLAIQKDEVVQIALIQVLVKMKEKGIIKDLERITKDAEAFTGILKLS